VFADDGKAGLEAGGTATSAPDGITAALADGTGAGMAAAAADVSAASWAAKGAASRKKAAAALPANAFIPRPDR
jgi:hypothetical protein